MHSSLETLTLFGTDRVEPCRAVNKQNRTKRKTTGRKAGGSGARCAFRPFCRVIGSRIVSQTSPVFAAIPPLHLRARMLAQATTRSGPKGGNHQHESSDIREFSYCAPMTVSAAKACPELSRNYLKHLVAGSKDGPETLLERLLSRKALEREREREPTAAFHGGSASAKLAVFRHALAPRVPKCCRR